MRKSLLALVLVGCGSSSATSSSPPPPPSTTDGGTTTTTPPLADAGTTTADASTGPRFVDTCNLQASSCTMPAVTANGGLVEVDRCAYALTESDGIATTSDVLAAIAKITTPVAVADVLADGNRIATTTTAVPGNPAGVQYAFEWASDDQASTAWTPQGISGTADAFPTGKAGDQAAVLVSFYDEPAAGDEDDGVRIAFVNTTTAVAPKYRFVLLVEPSGTAAAPTFVPVKVHAGGLVWYGNYVYIADTNHGLRVFDMRQLLEVAVDPGNFGCEGTTCRAGTYKYVLPQVGTYAIGSACAPLFSWVSLDRGSDPPSLVSGEYCATTACSGPLAGRVLRWPLDPTTGLLRSLVTFPTEAYLMGQTQVQGGAAINGVFYFSSSQPAGDGGDLFRVSKGKSETSGWGNNPEDLMVDPANGWLWNLGEKAGFRSVYAVAQSSYPPP